MQYCFFLFFSFFCIVVDFFFYFTYDKVNDNNLVAYDTIISTIGIPRVEFCYNFQFSWFIIFDNKKDNLYTVIVSFFLIFFLL